MFFVPGSAAITITVKTEVTEKITLVYASGAVQMVAENLKKQLLTYNTTARHGGAPSECGMPLYFVMKEKSSKVLGRE
jgi:hypothetical protein